MRIIIPLLSAWNLRSSNNRGRKFKAIVTVLLAGPLAVSSAYSEDFPANTEAGTASKIEETYGNWTVLCLPRNNEQACAVRQLQIDRKSMKPVLLVELHVTMDMSAEGGVMLPAGLRLADGIRVALDGRLAGKALPIRGCTEKGCFATVTFAGPAFEKIKSGKLLQLIAVGSNGSPQAYLINLTGFAQAADREMHLEHVANRKHR